MLEYWIIDPQARSFSFMVLDQGRFVEFPPEADSLASRAVAGFRRQLGPIREITSQWPQDEVP